MAGSGEGAFVLVGFFFRYGLGEGSRCGCSSVGCVLLYSGSSLGLPLGSSLSFVRFVGCVVVVCWLAVLVVLVVVVETGWAAVRDSGGHGRGGGWVVFWTVVVVFSLGLVGRVVFFLCFFVFLFRCLWCVLLFWWWWVSSWVDRLAGWMGRRSGVTEMLVTCILVVPIGLVGLGPRVDSRSGFVAGLMTAGGRFRVELHR